MLRLAVSQFRPRKADYAANLRRLGEIFAEVAALDRPPDLLVLPEAALMGYFLEGGVQELAVSAERHSNDLSTAHRTANCPPIEVVIGFY